VRRRAPRAALLACAALLVLAAPAAGAPHMVGMEDERLLLDEPAEAPAAVAAWAAAGIDVVRVHARWGVIAPGGRSKPRGFNANEHRDPRYDWSELDHAVALVRGAGMKLMVSVTGAGPLWTSRSPARGNPRYKPDPKAFGAFARAVATRYGDRVDTYLIWNEPNIPGWLDPQLECRGKRCTPVAPHIYRDLLAAAYGAIKAADPGAEVVMGELAPIGRVPRSARSVIPPLTFYRAMACLDENYRAIRTGPCARFKQVRADAVGHHPHPVLAAPDEPSEEPLWAKMGDLPRLLKVLDRITATRRFGAPAATGGKFDLHLTEFGYQTSPPDHAVGVTVEDHARYLQHAAYIAWKTPRLRSLVHYQWVDEPVRYRSPGSLAYAGWQSGLHYIDGRPKPAALSFSAPFFIDGDRFWGQVRPGGAHRVTILRDGAPVAEAVTDEMGFWTQSLRAEPGSEYRFIWDPPAQPAADPGQPPQRRASVAVRVSR
jgi:hypothetical protein